MPLQEFPNLEKFLEEIGKLQKAHELLEKIWRELGHYDLPHTNTYNGLYPDLAYEIQDYFGFDDSE